MTVTQVAVVGAGSWGTTAAALLAEHGNDVRLWARRPELAAEIRRLRRNDAYVPGLELPASVEVSADMKSTVDGASVVVMAVPSHGFRDVLTAATPAIGPHATVVSLAKGLEEGSLLRMTQVIAEVAPGRPAAVLTGPNLVKEIANRLPAAAVAASGDERAAALVQQLFSSDSLRVYTNGDVTGCELAGALKNVIAIGIGMADGLALGANAKAALMTRGLAELTRLGVALGGQAATFSGLAGLGDLVATCTSDLSRNRSFGEQLALGRTAEAVAAGMSMVAEGVRSTGAVLTLAARAGVEMPVASSVAAVLAGTQSPEDATHALMHRALKGES